MQLPVLKLLARNPRAVTQRWTLRLRMSQALPVSSSSSTAVSIGAGDTQKAVDKGLVSLQGAAHPNLHQMR